MNADRPPNPGRPLLRLADGEVDLVRREVRRGGHREALTPREVALLGFLAGRPGEVVDRDELVHHLGGGPRAAYHVAHRLRVKIEVDPAEPKHLVAVGGGLRLDLAEVRPTLPPGEVTLVAAALADPGWERDPAGAVQGGADLERAVLAHRGAAVALVASDELVVLGLTDLAAALTLARRLSAAVRGAGVAVTRGDPVASALVGWRGAAVHRAARLAGAAAAGTVVLGAEVARALDQPTVPLGTRRIPGLRDPEALASLGAPPRAELPTPATGFVGRRAESAAVTERWADGARLVTLCGPGGIGKTRLALEIARGWSGSVAWAELRPASTRADLVSAVTLALKVPTAAPIADTLRVRGPLLVVLDDVDQVADALAPELAGWLAQAGELAVLATGRVPIRIEGEHVLRIGPLAEGDATELFSRRARAARSDVALEPGAVGVLMERLEGWPLAIELCASRVSDRTVEGLVDELRDRFATLRSRRRDLAAHHGSLEAVLSSSTDALDPGLRSALARISVFRGGFDLDAARAVLGPTADEALGELVDRSLVGLGERDGGLRYELLDAVREHAASVAELGDAIGRHADYYLGRAGVHTPSVSLGLDPGSVAWFGREHHNLVQVHRNLLEADPARAAQALLALEPWWTSRGPATLSIETLDTAVACALRSGDREVLAQAHRVRAHGRRETGDFDGSEHDLQQAETLARALGDDRLRVRLLSQTSHLRFDQGRLDEADALAGEAQALAIAVGDEPFAALTQSNRGVLQARRGWLAEGERHLREAIAKLEALGAARLLAIARGNLGMLLMLREHDAEAEPLLESALAGNRRLGNDWHEAMVLCSLAELRQLRGDLPGARTRFEAALASARRTGGLMHEVAAKLGLALEEVEEGHPVEALAVMEGVDHPLAAAIRALLGDGVAPEPDGTELVAVLVAAARGEPLPPKVGPEAPVVRIGRRVVAALRPI